MRLETLAKDGNSGDAGCPSVHLDHEDGQLVVQSDQVDSGGLPNCLPGEAGVKLSPGIVAAAVDKYREMGLL